MKIPKKSLRRGPHETSTDYTLQRKPLGRTFSDMEWGVLRGPWKKKKRKMRYEGRRKVTPTERTPFFVRIHLK